MTPPVTHPVPTQDRHPNLSVPLPGLWPVAVRTAELTRGSLLRCGPGVRPAGWPDTPRVRLAALDPWIAPGHIAVLTTAAWVWGVISEPGHPLHTTTAGRRRGPRNAPPGVRVHQFWTPDADTVQFGAAAVTTPGRTLCDLLRLTEEFTRLHRRACRLLRYRLAWDTPRISAALASGAAPYRARALERLRQL